MPRTILKIGALTICIAVLVVVSALLFFEKEVKEFWSPSESPNESQKNGQGAGMHAVLDRGELVIAYATPLTTLEPTSFQATDRARTANIYEPLIRQDRNLNIEPVLAVSYGILEPTLWEFTLRENVFFHDGSSLDSEDVFSSIVRATGNKNSELKTLLSTIEKIEIKDTKILYIYTKEPDPLLLNKLSTVLIFPKEVNPLKTPAGTGPYMLQEAAKNEEKLVLNNNYWDGMPAFSEIVIKTIPDKKDRIKALQDQKIDILADVPPDSAADLNGKFQIKRIPSLEVSFLMFNFQDKELKEKIPYAIDRDKLIQMTFGFARKANQFVSNGVFGFNPRIAKIEKDLKKAKVATETETASGAEIAPNITLDIAKGLEKFGQVLSEMFSDAGITLTLNFLDWDSLNKKIQNKDTEMYFLGWKSELGDAYDFLNSVAYSKGNFNNGIYQNLEVDKLIEESSHEMNTKKRLALLQKAMEIITETDIMGVPLIEAETTYAIAQGIEFEPRLDGLILIKDIK